MCPIILLRVKHYQSMYMWVNYLMGIVIRLIMLEDALDIAFCDSSILRSSSSVRDILHG